MMSNSVPPSLSSPPWSGRTKRTVVLILGGLFFLLALQLIHAWTIVIIAIVVAYLLNPIVNFCERKPLAFIPYRSLRRSLAVALTFALVLTLLALAVVLIFPPMAQQMQDFSEQTPDLFDSYQSQLESFLSHPIQIGATELIIWNELQKFLGDGGEDSNLAEFDMVETLRGAGGALFAPVINVATIALTFLVNTFFFLVITFYLMKDGAQFVNQLEQITPPNYQGDMRRLMFELALIWDAYLRGQLFLGVVMGFTTGIAAALVGLPQPLVLGFLAGLLEFIPNLGPILATFPALLFALISESTTIPGLSGIPFALITVLIYTALQQLEALFLVPRVMGISLNLHPLAVLIAVLSGAAVAGLLGILLAAPTLATMRLFLIYIWGKLFDLDPFQQTDGRPHAAHGEPALVASPTPALASPTLPEQSGEIIDE